MIEFKVGDEYECPEGHKGKIVWIHEDMNMIGVRCSKSHMEYSPNKGKFRQKNIVFIIRLF